VQVFENGRFVATNDSERILMPAGLHTIDVVNEALNFRASTTVDVSAGEASRADVTVPTGTLSVNAVPWSEVFVDGRSVGETPLAGISVLVGAHEIVFRHPDLGERRRTVVVPAGAPAIRVSVDFAQ